MSGTLCKPWANPDGQGYLLEQQEDSGRFPKGAGLELYRFVQPVYRERTRVAQAEAKPVAAGALLHHLGLCPERTSPFGECLMAARRALAWMAGGVWMSVGVGLIIVAAWWLTRSAASPVPGVSAGLIGGLAIARFKLGPLAAANLARIASLCPGQDRVSLLQFQSRRSYVIIAVMIAMGYILRHSALPKAYLAPVYLAMGLGLLLAGLRYFRTVPRSPESDPPA